MFESRWTRVLTVSLTVATLVPVSEAADRLTSVEAERLVDTVMPRVEELRGLAFREAVPVEVVDDGAMREYVLDRVSAFDQEAHLETLGRVYALLGLIPDGTGLLDLMLQAMEEQAGGFYDPGTGAYYLMDDVATVAAPIFTAHELTHALEDQHYDLDRRLRETIEDDDRSLAKSAVHEGSATLLMSVYVMGAVLRGELDTASLQEVAAAESGRVEQLQALPEVLQRQLLGPYVLGALFFTRGDIAGMMQGFPAEAVDRAMRDGPTSTEQILHPEKFWDEEARDEPVDVRYKGIGRALGKGWTLQGTGVLGELTIGTLVAADTPLGSATLGMTDGAAWTNEAASGWGGDRWELWRRGDARVVALRTDWDSVRDAEEFVEALTPREGLRWKRRDERVAIVVGATERKARRLLSRMLR